MLGENILLMEMANMAKKRLDLLVHEYYPQYSRQQIQSWIMQGKVLVEGKPITKSGSQIHESAAIELRAVQPKYVSRAGLKLEHALDHFNIDVQGLDILDAGISTGGFTDCLLQRGANKIFGVDVGYGQVAEKVRKDERVVVLERTNLRHLKQEDLKQNVDLVTLDLSFISILKVMEAVAGILKEDGLLITLIKPQFEAGKGEVGKGGVITNPLLHKKVVQKVVEGIERYGFVCEGVIESPIFGATGNKEFLACFKRK